MNIISTVVKRHLTNLRKTYDMRLAEAEVRARRRLELAKSRTEREKVILQLQRERAKLRKEMYEARIATQKARTAAEKARKEAGDLTLGERVRSYFAESNKPSKPKRATKRATGSRVAGSRVKARMVTVKHKKTAALPT